MMFQQIRNACSLLRRGRFFQLTDAVVSRILPARCVAMKKYFLLRYEKDGHVPPRVPEGWEILRNDPDAIAACVRDLYAGRPETREIYEQFYRDGVEPFFFRREEKIVGAFWVYTGSYVLAWEGYDKGRLRIELEPTAKFFANEFVAPTARRQGIATAFAAAVFAAYPDSAFYTCIEESNLPALRSREKIGFRRCGTVYFFRLGKTTWCFFRPHRGRKRRFRLAPGEVVDVSLVERVIGN